MTEYVLKIFYVCVNQKKYFMDGFYRGSILKHLLNFLAELRKRKVLALQTPGVIGEGYGVISCKSLMFPIQISPLTESVITLYQANHYN